MKLDKIFIDIHDDIDVARQKLVTHEGRLGALDQGLGDLGQDVKLIAEVEIPQIKQDITDLDSDLGIAKSDIEAMKGIGRVAAYLGQTPSQQDITDIWVHTKGKNPLEGATVVNLDQDKPAGHVWTLLDENGTLVWKDRGTDTVNQADNSTYGVVVGEDQEGYGYIKIDNGKMKLADYVAMITAINSKLPSNTGQVTPNVMLAPVKQGDPAVLKLLSDFLFVADFPVSNPKLRSFMTRKGDGTWDSSLTPFDYVGCSYNTPTNNGTLQSIVRKVMNDGNKSDLMYVRVSFRIYGTLSNVPASYGTLQNGRCECYFKAGDITTKYNVAGTIYDAQGRYAGAFDIVDQTPDADGTIQFYPFVEEVTPVF